MPFDPWEKLKSTAPSIEDHLEELVFQHLAAERREVLAARLTTQRQLRRVAKAQSAAFRRVYQSECRRERPAANDNSGGARDQAG